MPGNPNEIKLVNNAMANATRRKIMSFLADGDRSIEEIESAAGKLKIDFHLKILQRASLIELEEGTVKLSEYGRNFLKNKAEKCTEKTTDLSQAKPVEISEVRQLLPCMADSSKFRVIANMAPPLEETLEVLEPLFPRGKYSDKANSLIFQEDEIIITIYGTGKIIMTKIKNEREAGEMLENLKNTINEAIAKGVAPSREKATGEPMEIDKDLPHTNCDRCSERNNCHKFAVKPITGEVSLDNCTLLNEPEYADNPEHL